MFLPGGVLPFVFKLAAFPLLTRALEGLAYDA